MNINSSSNTAYNYVTGNIVNILKWVFNVSIKFQLPGDDKDLVETLKICSQSNQNRLTIFAVTVIKFIMYFIKIISDSPNFWPENC